MKDLRERTQSLLGDAARSVAEAVERVSADVAPLIEAVVTTFRNGNKVLICGNGGSAADAQHMAAEFVNRFKIDRPPLAAIALTTDSSILTSIGNDFSFHEIFSKQVEALGKPGDLFIGITTSGNSPNIIRALQAAKQKGLTTAALLGRDGGKARPIADIAIVVPLEDTARIQEVHLMIEHAVCEITDEILFATVS
jgi:D-sedoheptulose 7-phosphate isomerase